MKKMNDREVAKETVLMLKILRHWISNATFGQRKRWKSESMSVWIELALKTASATVCFGLSVQEGDITSTLCYLLPFCLQFFLFLLRDFNELLWLNANVILLFVYLLQETPPTPAIHEEPLSEAQVSHSSPCSAAPPPSFKLTHPYKPRKK